MSAEPAEEREATEPEAFAEPVLGLRVWSWNYVTNTIGPCVTYARKPSRMDTLLTDPKQPWSSKSLVGVCARGSDHAVPAEDCSCGVYAATDIEVLLPYIRSGADVMGVVQGFGLVQNGDFGWRAEEASIACFLALAEDFTLTFSQLDGLAIKYGVPLVRPTSLEPEAYREAVRSQFLGLDLSSRLDREAAKLLG